MNNSISFTIPLEAGTLNRTAEMLQGMAADLTAKPCGGCKEEKPAAVIETIKPATNTTLDGAENMGGGDETVFTSRGTIDEQQAAIAAAKLKEGFEPPGVDLDSAGLPWDVRIHSGGKTKLVNGGTWKRKRGLDAALIEQVEAELRAAMAAPAATVETPAATETKAPPTPPAIVETTTPPATTETKAPPTPPATNAEPLTWPLLMSKVTNGIALGTLTNERINEVVNKHGLASLPLLSVRPDLIPVVDAELFPNV